MSAASEGHLQRRRPVGSGRANPDRLRALDLNAVESDMTELMRWWELGYDAWRLGLEAGEVMARRSAVMASGGTEALLEANLMVSEKVAAAAELQMAMITGKLGKSPRVVSHALIRNYRGRVRRNVARLR